jgi:WD40 repeat protein
LRGTGEKATPQGHVNPALALLLPCATGFGTGDVELPTGKERHSFALPHPVRSLAFAPDGRRLIWGEGQASICVWDPVGGRPVCQLHGHQGWVGALALSPDGKLLASGSKDSTVVLWDLEGALAGTRPPAR